MAEAVRLYRRGEYLEQNLYGALTLEQAGFRVRYLAPRTGVLSKLSVATRYRLGDLSQQRQAISQHADVIFVGAEQSGAALSLLRLGRALRTPVCVVHHNPPSLGSKAWVPIARGYDLVFTLSRRARDGLVAIGRDPATTIVTSWGPQLDHPAYVPAGRELVVSTGKSRRDIDLLAAALDGEPAIIYAPPGWDSRNERVITRSTATVRLHTEVLADTARASVVAIPFTATEQMLGLTELNDALALAKPIVMTRSQHIDVDIESVGCGFWVEAGDIDGWRRALTFLREHPDEAAAMGRRGRAWAEQHWNSEIFGRQILTSMEELLGA